MAKRQKTEIADEADESDILMNTAESETDVSKCPSCGANLKYSPSERCLYCEYCGHRSTVDLSEHAEEMDFAELLRSGNNEWGEDAAVFRCNNCGAKAVISKREIAPKCSFCGTSNIIKTEELCGIKPNAVIPFRIDRKQCSSIVVKWVRKRLLAPRRFKKECKKPDELAGNYFPAFTFDSNTTTNYNGVLGKYYYTTRRVGKTTITTRHTRYFPVSGVFEYFFDDVFVPASNEENNKAVNSVKPFDTTNAQSYNEDFLFGFTATHYEKDGLSCWGNARQQMETYAQSRILGRYSYDTIQYFNKKMHCYNMTYKYTLLPVYIGHCTYKSKNYNFYVNGQTGKVKGKTPKSPLKIALLTLLGLAVVAGAVVGIIFAL